MSDSYPGPGYEYYDRENGVARHYPETDGLAQRELIERMRRDQAAGYIGSPMPDYVQPPVGDNPAPPSTFTTGFTSIPGPTEHTCGCAPDPRDETRSYINHHCGYWGSSKSVESGLPLFVTDGTAAMWTMIIGIIASIVLLINHHAIFIIPLAIVVVILVCLMQAASNRS